MMAQEIKCPECGNDGTNGGIYARADIRWNGSGWTVGDVEDALDCTECDAAWSASEANIEFNIEGSDVA